ncbi:MAG: PD40 domain-containing protein [Bacteroidales bacterium]|nr:PD40 domain-containing protein [Bacteroidales bacterium]
MVKKLLIFGITMLLFLNSSFSQKVEYDKVYKQKLAEANYHFENGNYHLSLPVLKELYDLDSTNMEVNYKTGFCIFTVKRDKKESLPFFEKSKDEYIDGYYYLGLINHLETNFSKAIDFFQFYKSSRKTKSFSLEEVDYRLKMIDNSKNLMESPKNVWLMNLGEEVNSPFSEYAPVISPDEKYLFFTSRRKGSIGGLLDPYNEFFEDIYVTEKDGEIWTKPLNIGAPINSSGHDATVTISPDGTELYIFRTNSELTGGDIYVSNKEGEAWSSPQKIAAEINTKSGLEASACISPDGLKMYFSSNRAGGYGGKDLYMVNKLPNGQWSKAQNLGPVINTPYDEDSPFMDVDGITLYFSSRGHSTMGGYDLFSSTINEKEIWSSPENLGYPINTVNDEIYFVITQTKEAGYFSSNRKGGFGLFDIYAVDMPENWTNYMLMLGEITTVDSLTIVNCKITLIDQLTNKVQGIYRPNKRNGKFVIIAMPNKKYKMIVEAGGFHNVIKDIEVNEHNYNKILGEIKLQEKE